MPSLLNVAECQNDMLMSATGSMRIGCVDVADVEQQAVAAARAAGETDVRVDRDVVALVRPAVAAAAAGATGRCRPPRRHHAAAAAGAPAGGAALQHRSAAAAALRVRGRAPPRPGSTRRGGGARPVKMRGELTIAAFCGAASGTLITSRRKRARVRDRRRGRPCSPAARRPNARRPSRRRRCRRCPCRADRSTTVCVCEPRHVCTLVTYFGLADVRDVEDADAAHPLLADRLGHALNAAVDAARLALARHEQQVLVDRHVVLRRRADVRQHERRLGGVRDVEDLEAVVVALDRVLAGEREVGAASRRGTSRRAASSRRASCSRRPGRHPSDRPSGRRAGRGSAPSPRRSASPARA